MTSLIWTFLTTALKAEEPVYLIRSLRSPALRTKALQTDIKGYLLLDGDRHVSVEQLISVEHTTRPRPAWPASPHVWLTNDDRYPGKLLSITANKMTFSASFREAPAPKAKIETLLELPRTSARIIWLKPMDWERDRQRYPQLDGSRRNDFVIMTNGETLEGTIVTASATSDLLELQKGGQMINVPLSRVAILAFNTELNRVRKPEGAHWVVCLTNGSRIRSASLISQDAEMELQNAYRQTIRVAKHEFHSAIIEQGQAVYLSSLKPAKYHYHSYLGENWSWHGDRGLNEQQLSSRLTDGISFYDRGLSLHGACEIEYELGGNYQRFETGLSLDPVLGKRGSVDVRILVDGKEQPLTGGAAITGQDRSRWIEINLRNAKALRIVIEAGTGGQVDDAVNLLDARLIRE